MIQPIEGIDLVTGGAWVISLAALSGVIAVVVAAVYRWYTHIRVPGGLTVLLGLAGVAISLNTTAALGQVIGGRTGLLDADLALLNVTTFAVAALAAVAGGRLGDVIGRDLTAMTGVRELDAEVGRLVRTVGRVTSVTLPGADEIEDLDGYDPVPAGTKEAMGGKTLLFPRGLTVAELTDRLSTRLKEDHGIGHVGVELTADGSVEYLGIGSRASGIGPTLAPGSGATAIRADPPSGATTGDVLQVWLGGDDPERVATAELRGTSGDVVTLSLDEAEAEAIDPTRRYRLLTLPVAPRAEQEFASLLRSSDETMGVATVAAGSPLAGTTVGDLDATVVAVRAPDGTIEPIPSRRRTLSVGDEIYAIARPERLRRLEAAARAAADAD